MISQKNEFDNDHINKIKKYADVTWIDSDRTNILEIPELYDKEEKIIAFSPVPMDWKIPSLFYDKLQNVKSICLVTTSFDFIDITKIKKLGAYITNVPYYSSEAVAEYAFFMLMALLKRFSYQLKSNFKYEFTNNNLMDEFGQKTVGIIGLGHVGEKIAQIIKSLGFNVVYWSQNKKNNSYNFVSFDKLIKQSDIIFPTYALNNETKNLLRKQVLVNLKDSAYFVNIIGENACDTEYLIERIEKGKLQGLAFESNKRKIKDYKGNIFITAPLAWYTKQSLKNNIDIWTDTIISCIKGKPINIVIESKLE